MAIHEVEAEKKRDKTLESYNDPRPRINQSIEKWFNSLIVVFFTYVRTYVRTDTITRDNEPLFKLVLFVSTWAWI